MLISLLRGRPPLIRSHLDFWQAKSGFLVSKITRRIILCQKFSREKSPIWRKISFIKPVGNHRSKLLRPLSPGIAISTWKERFVLQRTPAWLFSLTWIPLRIPASWGRCTWTSPEAGRAALTSPPCPCLSSARTARTLAWGEKTCFRLPSF